MKFGSEYLASLGQYEQHSFKKYGIRQFSLIFQAIIIAGMLSAIQFKSIYSYIVGISLLLSLIPNLLMLLGKGQEVKDKILFSLMLKEYDYQPELEHDEV